MAHPCYNVDLKLQYCGKQERKEERSVEKGYGICRTHRVSEC